MSPLSYEVRHTNPCGGNLNIFTISTNKKGTLLGVLFCVLKGCLQRLAGLACGIVKMNLEKGMDVSKRKLPPNHHDWAGLEPPEKFVHKPVVFEVSGPEACFTRPEASSERLSYSLMTPSAAAGVATSVFWKPQMRWVIQSIEVLAPVQWMMLRRNEVEVPITVKSLKKGHLDGDSHVQQRMSVILRDVSYRVRAQVWVHPEARDQNPAKYRDQFVRRVAKGQSYRMPYLGMREFIADISPETDVQPIDWTEDLGLMSHSIDYDTQSGKELYDWFQATVVAGVMHIPARGISAQLSKAAATS